MTIFSEFYLFFVKCFPVPCPSFLEYPGFHRFRNMGRVRNRQINKIVLSAPGWFLPPFWPGAFYLTMNLFLLYLGFWPDLPGPPRLFAVYKHLFFLLCPDIGFSAALSGVPNTIFSGVFVYGAQRSAGFKRYLSTGHTSAPIMAQSPATKRQIAMKIFVFFFILISSDNCSTL